MNKRIQWIEDGLLFVVRYGKTTNAKISEGSAPIVQTYTFDLRQFELANSGRKITPAEFYALDIRNCLDCPLSGNVNNGIGKCYTHKYMQFSGFLSMLRSIGKIEQIPSELDDHNRAQILRWCAGNYVRFGTYGEPALLPFDLVENMALNSKSWTGYTHQARKNWAQPFKALFMASAHSDKDAASITGWRSFIAKPKHEESAGVQCPASAELNLTNCSACGLCSGLNGKGKKNIKINAH